MSLLVERLLAVHDALAAARLPHAIGGAIALGYCTEEPRGTRDLDVNVFVDPIRFGEVVDALPAAVEVNPDDVAAAERDGQVRVFWGETPIDIFLNNVPFHAEVERSVRLVDLVDRRIPVVGCTALAVFKAMFDRTQDWADIEAMARKGSIDTEEVSAWLGSMVGPESPQVKRLAEARVRAERAR